MCFTAKWRHADPSTADCSSLSFFLKSSKPNSIEKDWKWEGGAGRKEGRKEILGYLAWGVAVAVDQKSRPVAELGWDVEEKEGYGVMGEKEGRKEGGGR